MEMLMNKKNLNRIQRRTAKLAYSQYSDVEPFSTISTFRTINPQKHHILQEKSFQDKISFKIDGFLSFCRQIKVKRNAFDQLSKPKANSCQKITKHNSFIQANRKLENNRNSHKPQKVKQINKTISFSFNQAIKTTRHPIRKIFTGQDDIELKNQQFKRRHQSLKNYQTLTAQQMTGIEKNTIMSNTLDVNSIAQIYEKKKMQDQKKQLINQMFRTGQLNSNEPGQSDEFRELSYLSNRFQNILSEKLPQTPKVNDIFDKITVQKYQKLLNQIGKSQKYCIESYDDYDKILTQRNPIYRRKKHNKNKILANYAEQWR